MDGRNNHSDSEACGGGCKFCSGIRSEGPDLRGWPLVAACLGMFLAPMLLALTGAILFRQSDVARFLAAVAGFGIGMTASALVARRLRSRAAAKGTPAPPPNDTLENE